MTTTQATTSASAVRDLALLPTRCPDWCNSGPAGHRQALEEGCTAQEASVHMADDYVGTVQTISDPFTMARQRVQPGGWSVEIRSQHDSRSGYHGLPLVRLELYRYSGTAVRNRGTRTDTELDLTSGEVRTLARQLLHMADRIDLHF